MHAKSDNWTRATTRVRRKLLNIYMTTTILIKGNHPNQWNAITECFGPYKNAAARSFWILTEHIWKDPGGIDRPSSNYEVIQMVDSVWKKFAEKNHRFIRSLNFGTFLENFKTHFAKNIAKFRPGFRSLEPPRVKQDSQCERRTGQKSTKIAKKKYVFLVILFS